MNDTLFICYFASKQGVKYRDIVEKDVQANDQQDD